MRKGEALYTYFMKTMAEQKRDEDGKLQLWLDGDRAVDMLMVLFNMPDDIFDKIVSGETSL